MIFGKEVNVAVGENKKNADKNDKAEYENAKFLHRKVVTPGRFERPTLCLEGRCSIQLSYGAKRFG